HRDELRRIPERVGLAFREDATNADTSRARAAVRHGLVPLLGSAVEAIAGLARVRGRLDDAIARRAPRFEPPSWAPLTRSLATAELGGELPRRAFANLDPALGAELLGRAVVVATGEPARGEVLRAIVADFAAGGRGRRDLAAGWSLELGASRVALLPPDALLGPSPGSARLDGSARVALADGRVVDADGLRARAAARGLAPPVLVRAIEPGDRASLGPGRPTRALARSVSELGVPVPERRRLVVAVDASGANVELLGSHPTGAA
ncbi:MAG: hypothetical protein R3F34_19480, partial [Planctomycetota bacterium]